jgi:hypothetical protein
MVMVMMVMLLVMVLVMVMVIVFVIEMVMDMAMLMVMAMVMVMVMMRVIIIEVFISDLRAGPNSQALQNAASRRARPMPKIPPGHPSPLCTTRTTRHCAQCRPTQQRRQAVKNKSPQGS